MHRVFKLEVSLKHIRNITISTYNVETITHLHLKASLPKKYHRAIVYVYKYIKKYYFR